MSFIGQPEISLCSSIFSPVERENDSKRNGDRRVSPSFSFSLSGLFIFSFDVNESLMTPI